MLRRALQAIERQAGFTEEALNADAFAEQVGEILRETVPYWQSPSGVEPTRSGVEFTWPNGMFLGLERSLGKWFLETDEELFPLTSSSPEELASEIDLILKAKGYDAWLSDTEMRFDDLTTQKW